MLMSLNYFFKGDLPSLVEEAYLLAKKRDIKEVGKQLKEVYKKVLED